MMPMPEAAIPLPADVGWSVNNGGISAVGRRRLEYESWKILTSVGSIDYISHRYPLCGRAAGQVLWQHISVDLKPSYAQKKLT